MVEVPHKEFLLEVGAGEIPAWMIPSAMTDLKRLLQEGLSQEQLAPSEQAPLEVFATPRRLVVWCSALPDHQATREELIEGPPKRVAFDASGKPTIPALKFAEKMGVKPGKLEIVSTPKGEYVACRKVHRGRRAVEVLKEIVPRSVLGIYFPRTMYWEGKAGPHFIRPIRWVLALYGGSVIPFSIGSVKAGRLTNGHRQLGKARLPVGNFAEYKAALRENSVILDPAERRSRIVQMTESVLQDGFRAKPNAELLETHSYLTEYPTPLLGSFDRSYLSLPEEVLITVMRGHQKYFAVEDSAGNIAPHFVAVMESDGDPQGMIRHGHERVLRARFNDARFFWEADAKTALEARLELLKSVTFQHKLGSYFEKAERMPELAQQITLLLENMEALKEGREEQAARILDGLDPHAAIRAARLAKCDLTTDLVKEFTELQGVVGGLSARREGLGEEVATAIYDHYRPQSMEDELPRTLSGAIVSLADRLDTLAGCFGVGLAPSGSKDPFGLRRAAQGVIRILAEKNLRLPLDHLVAAACLVYENERQNGKALAWEQRLAQTPLLAFFDDRLRYYLREVRGFAYDEVNAVLAAGKSDVPDVLQRITAVAQIRPTENFEPLAASFKRMKNILQQGREAHGFTSAELREELLEVGPERQLYDRYRSVAHQAEAAKQRGSYLDALQAIASLRPDVDRFFDAVMVMVKEPELRSNRLSLLETLLREFSTIADFSEIIPRETPRQA